MRKRTFSYLVRLDEKENEIVKIHVKKSGLTREAYTRAVLLGRLPREKPDERFYTVMREMSAIGNNLNQIARKAAALNFIDAPFYKKAFLIWNDFRVEVKRKFLEPEKLDSGSPQSPKTLWGEEQPRSVESFASQGESD